jgi:predicted metal-binding membrane protein
MADLAYPASGFERGISSATGAGMGSERAFLGVAALVFLASVAAATRWCGSMSAMAGAPMPGGWTISMAWMPMCGQTWPVAAASFLGMWVVMMLGMMSPALLPMLWRYRQAVGRAGEGRLGLLTLLAGAGYFAVWTALGIVVFPLGAGLAAAAMQEPALARAVPLAAGAIVLFAGAVQFTAWKLHHLARCRTTPGCCYLLPADAGAAMRHGLRLGGHCAASCANLTAILLVMGVMDLGVMAVVTAAITAERLLPAGESIARGIGAVAVTAGLLLTVRAAGLV